jgi:hypothetical protein
VDLPNQVISQFQGSRDGQRRLKHREQYAALIDRLKTIIAPHKRLPEELLAYIFYLALPPGFRIHFPSRICYPGDRVARRPVLPWSFGHICSAWRQVALTDYRLWNRIRIQSETFEPSHTQILKTVLARSGSAALELGMTAGEALTLVSNIILPLAGRISRLNLDAGYCYPGDFSPFLDRLSVPGYALSSLTEASLYGDRLKISDGGVRIFGDCPLLRKLEICLCDRQYKLMEAIRGLRIPFSQLTELTLDIHSSPHIMLCILKDAPNLVRCSVIFSNFSILDDPAFDLVLPDLENLKLFSDRLEILIRFLQHITLPSLLQLYTSYPSAWKTPNALPSVVLALIIRSSCHLMHITMEGNLGPIVEHSHRSLDFVGVLPAASFPILPASTSQRLSCRELTLPHLVELNCVLNLDTFTDAENLVKALWSNGGGRGDIRRVFQLNCKINSGSAARQEDFGRWEEEMRDLFKSLSIDGWVHFLDGDDNFADGE